MCAADQDLNTRYNIPAHFDIFSAVTAVIALDDAAQFGNAGLYTLASGNGEGCGSNHVSLRRYFRMNKGDAVLHSVEVQHGVEIPRDVNRTSLIVWFIDKNDGSTISMGSHENDNIEEMTIKSSLSHLRSKLQDDSSMSSILNFILGSSLESIATYYPDSETSFTSGHALDCYIVRAMAKGNSNAFSRLGSLCENNELSPNNVFRIISILEKSGSLLLQMRLFWKRAAI